MFKPLADVAEPIFKNVLETVKMMNMCPIVNGEVAEKAPSSDITAVMTKEIEAKLKTEINTFATATNCNADDGADGYKAAKKK